MTPMVLLHSGAWRDAYAARDRIAATSMYIPILLSAPARLTEAQKFIKALTN